MGNEEQEIKSINKEIKLSRDYLNLLTGALKELEKDSENLKNHILSREKDIKDVETIIICLTARIKKLKKIKIIN